MKQYDIVVIGFGKAGKTFAKFSAQQGKKVAVIEASKEMYGGTCINIACIPTKTLVEASNEGLSYSDALARKNDVVAALNKKNYHNIADEENVDVIDGVAKFVSNKEIDIALTDGGNETVTADTILINTGATTNMLSIDGVDSPLVYDSTSIMNLKEQPKRLVIIGGGYIALEFASMMNQFGTDVTVLERSSQILSKEDPDIADAVRNDLSDRGIEFITDVDTKEITTENDVAKVHTSTGDYEAEAVLVAAGRHPNTENLGLENTDIKVGEHGEIVVDEKLQSTVDGIYAAGDVVGGMQFTYKSLDDFRIVKSQVFGDGSRTQNNRGEIPYAVFITPVLARIGLTAQEAKDKGFDVLENQLPVNQIPRHKINNDPRGLFKVVVDNENSHILGATLYGQNAEELINYIKLAMDNDIPYTYIRDAIFTHPTMSESFNDLMKF
ncbi:MAG: FAD-containing oxidoreductase [Aerococcus sp.]|nr:FAD-containing oxidoreductase [Aerococcus sp.]